MSVFVCSLNSGSNGNCYYIGNDEEAVLVDAGLTCRETEKRMRRAGLDINKVKAVFISHEHGDHIRGIEVISAKYKLPVYITESTLLHSRLRISKELLRFMQAEHIVTIGALSVHVFPKQHDAADPHSFIIQCLDLNIGVLTDIGVPCRNVTDHFKKCHAAFLEANYDDEMLEKGRYPYHLKKRIRGGEGHLSNKQALDLFIAHRPAQMSHLFLSHLSKDNNDPELALELFKPYAGNTEVIIASRYEETDVYQITGGPQAVPTPARQKKTRQISLF